MQYLFMLRTASLKKTPQQLKKYIVSMDRPPICDLSGTYPCEGAQTYLISRLHEDVIGDLSKGQPQVNDVILSAAPLRKIADMHHAASARFPLYKLIETKSSGGSAKDISLLASIPVVPNGFLPPNNDRKTTIYKINAEKNSLTHTQKAWILCHLFTQQIHNIFNEQSHPGLCGNKPMLLVGGYLQSFKTIHEQ